MALTYDQPQANAEDLDALAVGTMIRDHMGNLHVRHETYLGLRLWQEVGVGEDLTSDELVARIGGAFQVMHDPTEPRFVRFVGQDRT